MTIILILPDCARYWLQRWRRVRCALGLIACNIDVNTLESWWGETHQQEEGGGHQVETEGRRLWGSHGLQGRGPEGGSLSPQLVKPGGYLDDRRKSPNKEPEERETAVRST